MEKKTQSFRQDFKMPHLFREDLETIETIIKDLPAQKFKFETIDFEYETVQEISRDTETVNDFRIDVRDPDIQLNFTNSSAEIYASNDDIKTRGIVGKIIDIISKRERKYLWYFWKLTDWLPLVFIFSTLLLLLQNLRLFFLFFFFVVSIACVIAVYRSLHSFSIIEFDYKKNRVNYFVRNKDQIILLLIGTVFGVVVSKIVEWLF